MWLRLKLLILINVGDHRRLPWSPEPDSNRRPRPYQERALPTELSGQTKSLAKNKENDEGMASKKGRQPESLGFPENPRRPPVHDNVPGANARRVGSSGPSNPGRNPRLHPRLIPPRERALRSSPRSRPPR